MKNLMQLFSQDPDTNQHMVSQSWKSQGDITKEYQIKGILQEKTPEGNFSSIQFQANDDNIFRYKNGTLYSLQLCLTILQQNFYLQNHQRMYQIKLKNNNHLITLSTSNFQIFMTFYVHLAKYCILKTFQKHFRVGEVLGCGTFGKVYNGQNIFSKQQVALKIFQKLKINQIQDGELVIINEIKNLQKLRKYHLSPLIGVYETNDCIILVLQKAQAGNMIEYIKMQSGNYNEDLVKVMMKKVLENLKELHSAGFIHRDIKPENILFSTTSLKSSLFLSDFGLTVQKKQCECSLIARKCSGTLGFIAPQVLHENKYDEKCDMFSLGCLFYYLHKGQSIFHEKTTKQIFNMTHDSTAIERKINNLGNLNEISKSLLKKLLQINPKNRLSAEQALNHIYFNKVESYKVWTGEEDRTLRQYLASRIDKFYH